MSALAAMSLIVSIHQLNDEMDRTAHLIIRWVIEVARVQQAQPFELSIKNSRLCLETSTDMKSVPMNIFTKPVHYAQSILALVRIKLEANGFVIGPACVHPISSHVNTTDAAAAGVGTPAPGTTPTPDGVAATGVPSTAIVPRPTTVEEFFTAVGLTENQKFVVESAIPKPISMFMLCCADAEWLRQCSLDRVQIRAWERIAHALCP